MTRGESNELIATIIECRVGSNDNSIRMFSHEVRERGCKFVLTRSFEDL